MAFYRTESVVKKPALDSPNRFAGWMSSYTGGQWKTSTSTLNTIVSCFCLLVKNSWKQPARFVRHGWWRPLKGPANTILMLYARIQRHWSTREHQDRPRNYFTMVSVGNGSAIPPGIPSPRPNANVKLTQDLCVVKGSIPVSVRQIHTCQVV